MSATGSLHINRDIILAAKRQHLKVRREQTPVDALLALAQMQHRPRYFLTSAREPDQVTIIGQVTRTEMYDPVSTSLRYVREGADAIAFFTDHSIYENDLDDMLMVARGLKKTPIIYQNYVLDEYGVMGARASDASALVIYASLLEPAMLRRVISMTQRWKMTSMVQVTTPEELELACSLSPHMICYGDNLSSNVARSVQELTALREMIPHHIQFMLMHCLNTLDDVRAALSVGVNALLVGDALLNQERRAEHLRRLTGHAQTE